MTALDVADGNGSAGHERRIPADFSDERRVLGTLRHFTIVVLWNGLDLTGNFILGKGAERCIKLLAAWLLRGAATYNCGFPEQN
jgi:hypothetical protein